MCTLIDPVQCIVPPHMVDEIERNGTESQRRIARDLKAASEEIRHLRVSLMAAPAQVARVQVAAKERAIYNARQGTDLPGSKVRGEGEPAVDDPAVNEAYDGAGATYDLFKDVYGRESLDDANMRLDSTVHYRKGYDNAFWNGQQMVYGDGDEDLPEEERLFNRFTSAIEIIGHELTHGVVQFTAGLVYENQPGALNESFADVFGALVKQRTLNQTADEADWLIGAGLFTGNVNGQGIRSMKAPGTAYDDPVLGVDPQPAHMDDYKNVDYDNGGVHINSGIPNHAFYVTAREIGGRTWEKAGRVWYAALTDGRMTSRADFQAVADLTVGTAGDLFGDGSLEQKAVRSGWSEVGIQVEEKEPEEDKGGDG
ncbi:MAG: M4 family metallopeptidase, partial [Gemmatimonadetes bacterium]|nr:M4 family metallopeptidase [Gemmatimonadota bacterium]NIR75858.1 M4 family metallopeptidase [Candidatus Kutchimonas denitrificans]NIS02025.1 M4 family metallopeptidase [Gemmatimonadota bacterium]NIT67829.1 M4 family metallopeptidase [Gemmatimonadota bacterium]NIU53816.1 peptidase M4 family protein [Gemmatimonadota bacterium]